MKKGFTLVELIIVGGICMIFTLALAQSCGGMGGEEHASKVEAMAINSAEALGFKDVLASCEGRDSNGDGKVSCTVSFQAGNGRDSRPFLCPAAFSLTSTCQQGQHGGPGYGF